MAVEAGRLGRAATAAWLGEHIAAAAAAAAGLATWAADIEVERCCSTPKVVAVVCRGTQERKAAVAVEVVAVGAE